MNLRLDNAMLPKMAYLLLLAAVLFVPLFEFAGHKSFLPFDLLALRTFLPPTVNRRLLNPEVLVRDL